MRASIAALFSRQRESPLAKINVRPFERAQLAQQHLARTALSAERVDSLEPSQHPICLGRVIERRHILHG